MGKPLTAEESAELDAYGPISGAALVLGRLPLHAAELWARAILWGEEVLEAQPFVGLAPRYEENDDDQT